MPTKVVKIICTILIVSVFAIIGTMYTSDPNEIDDLVSKFNANTQNFQRTTVSTVIEESEEDNTDVDNSLFVDFDTAGVTDFITACKLAHNVLGHAGVDYSTTQQATINYITTDLDCNGYVGYALYLYGANPGCLPADEVVSGVSGLTKVDPAQHTLVAGDILIYSNHVEVYYSGSSGSYEAFNWGSHDTAAGAYKSDDTTSHSVASCTVSGLCTSPRDFSDLVEVYTWNGNSSYTPPPQSTQPSPSPPIPGTGGTSGGSSSGGTSNYVQSVWNKNDVDFLYDTIALYKQGNYPNLYLGKSGVSVSDAGCFVTSILNMVCASNNKTTENFNKWQNVLTASTSGTGNYFTAKGGLQNHCDFAKACGFNGSNYERIYDVKASIVKDKLDNGSYVIVWYDGGNAMYSGNSHFVFVAGYDYKDTNGDGVDELYILIADPGKKDYYEFCETDFDKINGDLRVFS